MREILVVITAIFLSACKTDLRKEFPADFWPDVRSTNDNCLDLSGYYKLAAQPDQVTEYLKERSISFPPGWGATADSIALVRQTGCSEIRITYRSRHGNKRDYYISSERNNLRWDSRENLFAYTFADAPDGFAGEETYRVANAYLGLGVDGSLLSKHAIHSKSRFFMIPTEYLASSMFRFPVVVPPNKALQPTRSAVGQ